jgi:hypothetical protein
MDKMLTSAIVIAVIALVSFSAIAVAAADRSIELNARGTCRGAVTVETLFSSERSTEYDQNIMSKENLDYFESLRTISGTTAFERKFFAPAGGSLGVTTVTNYSVENSSEAHIHRSGLGMARSEQAKIGRAVARQIPDDKSHLSCPFYVEQPPTIFGYETARGYNEQDIEGILITTRTIVDTSGMEILHGINATGQGSCSVGMGLNTQGEMVDRLNWETETGMRGEFDFESVGSQKGLTREEQYSLRGRP